MPPLKPPPPPVQKPRLTDSATATPAARQREAARLLMRMDAMLKAAGDLAERAYDRVGVGGLNRYRRFTRKVRDFFALAAVAEEKLDLVPDELGQSAMATALDRMHARMVLLFIDTSARFFSAFAKVLELPLGSHEICALELRGLKAIAGFLDDPRYEGERGQALRRQAQRVGDQMRAIMDRIPPLPDFGDLPSIGPKGGLKRPLKAPRRPPPPPPPPPPPAEEADVPAVDQVRELTLDDFNE